MGVTLQLARSALTTLSLVGKLSAGNQSCSSCALPPPKLPPHKMFGTGFITPLASIRRPWPGDTSADPKSAPSTAPPRSVPRMPRRALLAAGVVSTASVIIALAVRNPANAENLTDPRKVPEEVWAEKLSPLAYVRCCFGAWLYCFARAV